MCRTFKYKFTKLIKSAHIVCRFKLISIGLINKHTFAKSPIKQKRIGVFSASNDRQ